MSDLTSLMNKWDAIASVTQSALNTVSLLAELAKLNPGTVTIENPGVHGMATTKLVAELDDPTIDLNTMLIGGANVAFPIKSGVFSVIWPDGSPSDDIDVSGLVLNVWGVVSHVNLDERYDHKFVLKIVDENENLYGGNVAGIDQRILEKYPHDAPTVELLASDIIHAFIEEQTVLKDTVIDLAGILKEIHAPKFIADNLPKHVGFRVVENKDKPGDAALLILFSWASTRPTGDIDQLFPKSFIPSGSNSGVAVNSNYLIQQMSSSIADGFNKKNSGNPKDPSHYFVYYDFEHRPAYAKDGHNGYVWAELKGGISGNGIYVDDKTYIHEYKIVQGEVTDPKTKNNLTGLILPFEAKKKVDFPVYAHATATQTSTLWPALSSDPKKPGSQFIGFKNNVPKADISIPEGAKIARGFIEAFIILAAGLVIPVLGGIIALGLIIYLEVKVHDKIQSAEGDVQTEFEKAYQSAVHLLEFPASAGKFGSLTEFVMDRDGTIVCGEFLENPNGPA